MARGSERQFLGVSFHSSMIVFGVVVELIRLSVETQDAGLALTGGEMSHKWWYLPIVEMEGLKRGDGRTRTWKRERPRTGLTGFRGVLVRCGAILRSAL